MTRISKAFRIVFLLGIYLSAGLSMAASVDFTYQSGTLWGSMSDAVIDGKHLFCAMYHGLMIMDISDPTFPTPVSQYGLLTSRGSCITVAGNYAYLGTGGSGMLILEISDIKSPKLLGQFPVGGNVTSISIQGSTAFVYEQYSGVYTVDISDPFNPATLGFFPLPSGIGDQSCIARGDFLYICNYLDFVILNISDPANPYQTSSWRAPDRCTNMYLADSLVYLADDDSGLIVINVADPTAPAELARLPFQEGVASTVGVQGNTAYVGVGNSTTGYLVKIVDISDPTSPVSTGQISTTARTMCVSNGWLFTTNEYQMYELYDVSNPDIPIPLTTRSIPYYGYAGYGQEMTTDGRYLYVAGGEMGLVILDNADPSAPVVVSEGINPGRCFDLEMRDRYIYMLDDGEYYTEGLRIVDVSDPEQPDIVGFLRMSSCNKIALSGSYAFLGGNAPTNYIVDISDPTQPVKVGSTYIPGITRGFAIQGRYWYISYDTMMVIVDISDVTNPTFAGTLTADSPYGEMLMYKGYLLAAISSGLQVLDITTNPSAPTVVSFCPCRATDIKPYGDYLFVGNNLGATIIDMHAPESPVIIGSQQQGYGATAVAPYYNGLAAYNPYGMSIFQVDMPDCCSHPGDANYDLNVDLADVVYIINLIFKNGPPLLCPAAGDTNGDCSLDIGDAVHLVDYIFRSGDTPICPQCP